MEDLARYFLTCYDDKTQKIYITFLKAKSEAFIAMCDYIAKVERQLDLKAQQICSKNGGKLPPPNGPPTCWNTEFCTPGCPLKPMLKMGQLKGCTRLF
jgi:hypothetical protein